MKTCLDLIGNTPLIELTAFDTGPSRLFVKLESFNPSGSSKDRVGLAAVNALEKEGALQPGGVLVEATSGNTGFGLALVAANRGYKLILVMPDNVNPDKIQRLQAMGAEIVTGRSDVGKGHPEHYQEKAQRLCAETPHAVYINNRSNSANVAAHEHTTGPEIWEQMEHNIDAIVCGIGSGGTLTGLSRFFSHTSPRTRIILADPKGSIFAEYARSGEISRAGTWIAEDIGGDCVPSIADVSRVNRAYSISDRDAFETARILLRKQGICAGSSSGVLLSGALRYIREHKNSQRVVTFVCDDGSNHLSKIFDDPWMNEQGLLDRFKHGDLRDLISRSHQRGETIIVRPDESLNVACKRMKQAEISQLPVVDGNHLVGILNEQDILLSTLSNQDALSKTVASAMTRNPKTLLPSASLKDALAVFKRHHAVLIQSQDGTFHGVLTPIDVIVHLRHRVDA